MGSKMDSKKLIGILMEHFSSQSDNALCTSIDEKLVISFNQIIEQAEIDKDVRNISNSQYVIEVFSYYSFIKALENKGYNVIAMRLEGNALDIADASTSSVKQSQQE